MRKLLCILILICCAFLCFAQSANIYEVDLSKFPAVNDDKTATFDKATKTISFNKKYAGIYLWLGMNVSDYNIVKINYKPLDACGFRLELDDNSSEKESIYCPSNLKEVTIPLKNNQRTLNGFFISGYVPSGKVVINSITLEKVSKPQKTDLYANNEQPVIDTATKVTIDANLSSWDFVKKLGVGFQHEVFNINTFEYDGGFDFGIDFYHACGYVKCSKDEIHAIKEKGFKTLRLQTNAGAGHIMDENYTIDPRFIKEIKKVVDWAIEEGMYVIICGPLNDFTNNPAWIKNRNENIHLADYQVSEKDKKQSEKFIKAIWKQYAEAFNNSYDEHLIFETLNEPTDRFHEHSFNEKPDCAICKKDFAILNEYNQLIVDTIRASGGNNANRFIMVEGLGAMWFNITTNLFKMPNDKAKNKLIPTLHNYPMGLPPYHFFYLYTDRIKTSVKESFEALDKVYFSKHIPVYISETDHSRFVPIMERINCMKDFMSEVTKSNRSCAVTMMINVDIEGNKDNFCYFDEWNYTWFDTEYLDTVLYAAEGKEFPLSAEFLKNNETKVESIVGKNLINEPFDTKKWGSNYEIKSETFVRSVPESYKLEFVIKKTGSSPIIQITWSDENYQWHKIPGTAKKIKGGSLADGNVRPSKTTFTVEIDSETAKKIESSNGLFLMGQDVIIQSMKVVE